MDTTSAMLLTTLVVVGGKWSSNDTVSFRLVFGSFITAILLAVMAKENEKFAGQLAVLILVSAVFMYAPSIIKKTGIASKSK